MTIAHHHRYSRPQRRTVVGIWIGAIALGQFVLRATASEVQDTAADPPPAAEVTAVDRAEIEALVERFRHAVLNEDSDALQDCYDFDRMMAETKRVDDYPPLTPDEEVDARRGLALGVAESLTRSPEFFKSDRHEMTRIVRLSPHECLVYLRLHDGDYTVPVRWWVRDDPVLGWRIYDTEDLTLSLRHTRLLVSSLQAVKSGVRWYNDFHTLIAESTLTIADGNFLEAAETLQRLGEAQFPPRIEAVRYLNLAIARLGLRQLDQAELDLERALELNPDAPYAHFTLGIVYNAQGRCQEAAEAIERYADLLGYDAGVWSELGSAWKCLGELAKAAEAFRRGLDLAPSSVDNFVGLARVLTAPEFGELETRLANMEAPAFVFADLCEALIAAEIIDPVVGLARRFRELAPDDANADYYEGYVRLVQGRYDEAATLFESGITRAPQDDRQYYLRYMIEATVAAGRVVDAYHTGCKYEDRSVIFEHIADLLVADSNHRALSAIVTEHESLVANDRLLDYYRGEIHSIRGEHHAAIAAYRQGLEQAIDEQVRGWYTHALLLQMVISDSVLEAYRTDAASRDTTWILAGICAEHSRIETLERLVEAYRNDEPSDAAINVWIAEAQWMRGEFEGALDTLTEHRDAIVNDPESLHIYEYRLIAALLRLDRRKEAMEAAKASSQRDGDPFYEVIVYAAMGDAPRAASRMGACIVKHGYQPESFYDDLEFGVYFQGPMMEMVRRRHPRSTEIH